MNGLVENLTKILGSLVAAIGTVQGLITLHAFDGLMSDADVRWLSIACAVAIPLLGGATVARGFNNSAKVKVAEAMQTAIKSTPPKETDPNA